ncbi:DUF479 domain-containing protein [Vibrio sp. S9_S30]|nr:ACP phosphodiesterase [Vibrio sp. S9_S30]MBD1557536.1 DUF479 domain-containing protein [Vibrio sp. S9_S30]
MNYLAHLHIADHCKSSLLGNLLGDFVKGSPEGRYHKDIVDGIKLHRFVDSYTDTHRLVTSLKPLFPKELRRYYPIALDMFWDHCLANRWAEHHNQSLQQFCSSSELLIQRNSPDVLPSRYVTLSSHLWEGRWMESYVELENIQFALSRIAMRRPRLEKLSLCSEVLSQHYEPLIEAFDTLYPDVLAQSKQFFNQL